MRSMLRPTAGMSVCLVTGMLGCFDRIALEPSVRPCSSSIDCPYACVAGSCAAPVSAAGACSETADCAAPLLCVANLCRRADGDGCASNLECSDACVGAVCGPLSAYGGGCDEAADCASGLACSLGTCLLSNGSPCT